MERKQITRDFFSIHSVFNFNKSSINKLLTEGGNGPTIFEVKYLTKRSWKRESASTIYTFQQKPLFVNLCPNISQEKTTQRSSLETLQSRFGIGCKFLSMQPFYFPFRTHNEAFSCKLKQLHILERVNFFVLHNRAPKEHFCLAVFLRGQLALDIFSGEIKFANKLNWIEWILRRVHRKSLISFKHYAVIRDTRQEYWLKLCRRKAAISCT